jgi:hypothetical protein
MLWHRDHGEGPVAGDAVLHWSMPLMRNAIRALTTTGLELSAGYAAISDPVWAVTIVDAAIIRRHPGLYDEMLAAQPRRTRRALEDSLAGLRYVRNHIPNHLAVANFASPRCGGYDPAHRTGPGNKSRPSAAAPTQQTPTGQVPTGQTLSGVMGWQWLSAPPPDLSDQQGNAQPWEIHRYQAYHARLAGRPVGECLGPIETFLLQVATNAAIIGDIAP